MLKKANASPPPYWGDLKQKLKTTGLRPEIVAMLDAANQIVWEQSPPAGASSDVVAYVTDEDVNSDGKIDKIHFVLSGFPDSAPNSAEEMNELISRVFSTLNHEYAHILQYDPESKTNPDIKAFPDDAEALADAAEKAQQPILPDVSTAKLRLLSKILKNAGLKEHFQVKKLL